LYYCATFCKSLKVVCVCMSVLSLCPMMSCRINKRHFKECKDTLIWELVTSSSNVVPNWRWKTPGQGGEMAERLKRGEQTAGVIGSNSETYCPAAKCRAILFFVLANGKLLLKCREISVVYCILCQTYDKYCTLLIIVDWCGPRVGQVTKLKFCLLCNPSSFQCNYFGLFSDTEDCHYTIALLLL